MDVVPAATPATAKETLDEPASIVIGVCTVATAGSLLDSVMLLPVDAAAVSLTVPCTLPPAATLVVVSATLEMPGVVLVGAPGEPEPPHCTNAIAAIMVAASVTNDVSRRC